MSVTSPIEQASLPLALGAGALVFFLCLAIGQYAWRQARKQMQPIYFRETSCIGDLFPDKLCSLCSGEPTLLGLAAGLLLGTGTGIGVFYTLNPRFLDRVEAVIAISCVLSLLMFICCTMGCINFLRREFGIDNSNPRLLFGIVLCSAVSFSLACGFGLGIGLRQYINWGQTSAQFRFTQPSVIVASVVTIILVAAMVLFILNCKRAMADHNENRSRQNTLRILDFDGAHRRELKTLFLLGLHDKRRAHTVQVRQQRREKIGSCMSNFADRFCFCPFWSSICPYFRKVYRIGARTVAVLSQCLCERKLPWADTEDEDQEVECKSSSGAGLYAIFAADPLFDKNVLGLIFEFIDPPREEIKDSDDDGEGDEADTLQEHMHFEPQDSEGLGPGQGSYDNTLAKLGHDRLALPPSTQRQRDETTSVSCADDIEAQSRALGLLSDTDDSASAWSYTHSSRARSELGLPGCAVDDGVGTGLNINLGLIKPTSALEGGGVSPTLTLGSLTPSTSRFAAARHSRTPSRVVLRIDPETKLPFSCELSARTQTSEADGDACATQLSLPGSLASSSAGSSPAHSRPSGSFGAKLLPLSQEVVVHIGSERNPSLAATGPPLLAVDSPRAMPRDTSKEDDKRAPPRSPIAVPSRPLSPRIHPAPRPGFHVTFHMQQPWRHPPSDPPALPSSTS